MSTFQWLAVIVTAISGVVVLIALVRAVWGSLTA